SNPSFCEHVSALEAADARKLALRDLLIMPVQRLMRYPLIIREIVSNDTDTHQAAAKFALQLLSQVISEIDFLNWSHDTGIKTELLYTRLACSKTPPPARESLGGEMLLGSMLAESPRSPTAGLSKLTHVCAFLFPHFLLIVKGRKKSMYQLQYAIPTPMITEIDVGAIKNSFSIELSNGSKFEFSCAKQKLQGIWMTSLKRIIDDQELMNVDLNNGAYAEYSNVGRSPWDLESGRRSMDASFSSPSLRPSKSLTRSLSRRSIDVPLRTRSRSDATADSFLSAMTPPPSRSASFCASINNRLDRSRKSTNMLVFQQQSFGSAGFSEMALFAFQDVISEDLDGSRDIERVLQLRRGGSVNSKSVRSVGSSTTASNSPISRTPSTPTIFEESSSNQEIQSEKYDADGVERYEIKASGLEPAAKIKNQKLRAFKAWFSRLLSR
ncbi:MAG: hypothetical protein SGCHY_003077, partial [Lobulomycetales sp.]